jgi:glutaredoxin 3
MAVGLVCRMSNEDKPAVKQARHRARLGAGELVAQFTAAFSGLTCRQLVGYDFSAPGVYQQFLESGVWKDKCLAYVQFAVEKVYVIAGLPEHPEHAEPVTVYTKKGCPYCQKALRDLTERNVPFVEIVIDDDPESREKAMRLSGGKGIVPVLVTGNGEVTVGFGGG